MIVIPRALILDSDDDDDDDDDDWEDGIWIQLHLLGTAPMYGPYHVKVQVEGIARWVEGTQSETV
jgi:hypothetical protein